MFVTSIKTTGGQLERESLPKPMTGAAEVCCAFSQDPAPSSCGSSSVRFNLRKRTVSSERNDVNLASYNSAFLSGLFADVARANEQQSDAPEHDSPKDSSFADIVDPRLDETVSIKRSRISAEKSISRCCKSFKDLSGAIPDLSSSPIPLQKLDSVEFQLRCISSSSSSESSDFDPKTSDVCKLAFPLLPASVSNTSCTPSLTRRKSDPHGSAGEKQPNMSSKDCYGWFVTMDDEDTRANDYGLTYAASKTDLAFVAPTAPKRVNHDAELEWAQAADTVDDVLGDFF